MKYMTFNSSCSYAGIANLLSFYGVETSDRQFALDMGLTYFFDCEDGCYLAGPMLQGEKWFNIYLKPIGFTLTEKLLSKNQVCDYLSNLKNAMLGIFVNDGAKHAVIYTGKNNDRYCFLNNKREHSDEPERLELSKRELLQRLDETVAVADLTKSQPEAINIQKQLQASKSVLQALRKDIAAFCSQTKSAAEIKKSMNTLFRAILLDGITMLDLIGNAEISQKLKTVQNQFTTAIKENKSLQLNQRIDTSLLDSAINDYMALIDSRLNR